MIQLKDKWTNYSLEGKVTERQISWFWGKLCIFFTTIVILHCVGGGGGGCMACGRPANVYLNIEVLAKR